MQTIIKHHLININITIATSSILYGDIFLTEDKSGCALIVMPDKKKTSLKSIMLDAKLALTCMGLSNIEKAMAR